jgi:tetratricopeptide (TPR) repeat protein
MSRQKNDHDKAIIYAERALEADPQNYMAMLIASNELALITREHDLDREEKLKKAEKYANSAQEILKTAPRPRADITDEQWAAAKNDQFVPEAMVALGLAQMARKNCDSALDYLGKAVVGANPDPAKQLRLADANARCGKLDAAIAGFDKVIARADVPADFKAFAEKEKQRLAQRKGGAAAPAGTASPAPGQSATPAAPAPAAPKP